LGRRAFSNDGEGKIMAWMQNMIVVKSDRVAIPVIDHLAARGTAVEL
jgi:hypothetical protein